MKIKTANTKSMKMLVITSRPLLHEIKDKDGTITHAGVQALDVDGERSLIRDALEAARIPVEITFLSEATTVRIARALEEEYDVIHFTGHGTEDTGKLLIEDGFGWAYAIEPEAFRNLFKHKPKPKVLFLSACYSQGTASYFFDMNIPCVIYLTEKIADLAASLFCQHFYHAIARGNLCVDAFNTAVAVVAGDKDVGNQHPPDDIPELKYSQRFVHRTTELYKRQPLFDELPEGECKTRIEPRKNNVPDKCEHFLGKEKEMLDIIHDFRERKVIVVTAEPGMGKTELAKSAARWYIERDRFPGGVYWASAGEEEQSHKLHNLDSLLDITFSIASGMPVAGVPYEAKINFIMEHLSNHACLLVLDNYETVKADDDLWDFVKNVPDQTRVLITSRERLDETVAKHMDAGTLSVEKSFTLFIDIVASAGQGACLQDEAAPGLIGMIVELLAGSPLGIEVTAGQTVGSSLAEILDDLRENPSGVVDSVDKMSGKSIGVWTRLESSYEKLDEKEKQLFRRMGVLQDWVERDDIEALFGGKEATRTLKGLINRCLVKHRDKYFFMHPLVKEFALDMLKSAGETPCHYHLKAYEWYEDKKAIITAADHLYACGKDEDDVMRRFIELALGMVSRLQTLGLWSISYRKCVQGINGSRQVKDRESEARFTGEMGSLSTLQGQYEQALVHLNKSLDIHREIGDRKGEAIQFGNIGVVYSDQGRRDEALENFNKSLEIHIEIGARKGEAALLGNIGNVYLEQGKPDEALKNYKDALEIAREIGDRKGEAAQLDNIGIVYLEQGKPDEALKKHNDSLDIKREIGDRQGEALSLGNIGNVYLTQGKPDEALKNFNDALVIFKDLGARTYVQTTENNIALLMEKMKGKKNE